MNKNTITKLPMKQQQMGFSLLEVLVTVFVLSIGLLGIAGMQATSLKLSHEAHLRSQASLLATDIANRMRANPTISRNSGYNGTYNDLDAPDGSCLDAEVCDATQISETDLNNWQYNLGQVFPGAEATISTVDATGQIIATIQLIWLNTDNDEGLDSSVAGETREERTFTLRTVL